MTTEHTPPLDDHGPHDREPFGPLEARATDRRRLLDDALVEIGVDVGSYDTRILTWLTGWEYGTVRVVADLLHRAHAAGVIAATIAAADQVPQGCEGCREIGPLLIAPGTSGRTWRCGTCGTSWAPVVGGEG